MDFAPSVYEHCARFTGKTPWEVSRDADLLFQAQAAAFLHYRHRPVIVAIDIYNIEAEAYGATVKKPHGTGIPAIQRPLSKTCAGITALPLFGPLSAGRIPMLLEAGRRLARQFPEADVRIPVSGPFSIAMNLMGIEAVLTEAVTSPDALREALLHVVEGQVRFCETIVAANMGISLFESGAAPPLLSPNLFREIELPALTCLLRHAAETAGRILPCIIGGDTLPILEDLLSTETPYVICPAQTDQARFMTLMKEHPGVMVRINMKADIVARGTWEQIREEADRVAALALGRDKACIGTGALPYETPPEHIMRLKEYLADK